jgi:hypothetical protein
LNTLTQTKKARPTQEQVRDEEAVTDGEKFPARHARDGGGEGGVREQRHDQRAGEHPGEILDSPRRRDVVANRADDVVTAEDDEVEKARCQERPDLVRPDVDGFLQECERAVHEVVRFSHQVEQGHEGSGP